MSDLDVRIVKLEPMRVARVRVISETPERDAWDKMRAWAESKGLLADVEEHPVFGFNNPPPSQDRKEYGYELWIRVDSGTEPEGEVEAKDFAGGLYAVTTCKLTGDPKGNIFQVWQRLFEWVKSSAYKWRRTHELEKTQDPQASEDDFVLDLYLPIEE
ncbi:MAG: AraC family transcriptional regulator [Planctomycetota bacterium]|jgi:DNA gyrase inhibitor GyrI